MSLQPAVLDRISRVTPLGIRFWDEVAARTVADGLDVVVYPKGEPERQVAARANRIGTFVLPHLPGARDTAFERGDGGDAFWQRQTLRPYVIEVTDRDGCFQPFTIDQPLPARGLATPPCLAALGALAAISPPIDAVPLFSTPARPVPEGMAVLRAELRVRVPGQAEPSPASWAVLEVQAPGQPPARGVADRDGRVAVIFPYPEPLSAPARAGSPPFSAGQGLWDQEWTVRLTAFYDAVAPAPTVPDLCRTLAQRAALLWNDARATRPLPGQPLRYGQDLIVRDTFITIAGSPP